MNALARYFAASFVLGVSVILVSGSSFVLKSPSGYGLSDQQYGALFLYMVIPAVGITIGFKRLIDSVDIRRVYRSGAISCVLFTALMFAGAHRWGGADYRWFVLSQVFLGAGFGLFLSSLNALAPEAAPKHAAAAVAGVHAFFGLGAASAPLWIVAFDKAGHWPGVFAGVGAGFVLAFWAVDRQSAERFRRDHAHPAVAERGARAQGMPPLRAHAFFALAVGYGVAESLIANWSVPFLTEAKGFAAERAAVCLSVFWAALTAGRLFAAVWSLNHDPRLIQRISPWVMASGVVTAIFWRDESTVWLAYLWTGLGCSYFFPVNIGLAGLYLPRWKNFLAGYLLAGIMTGVGIGSTATGALKEAGFLSLPAAFGLAAGIAALLGAGSFVLLRKSF